MQSGYCCRGIASVVRSGPDARGRPQLRRRPENDQEAIGGKLEGSLHARGRRAAPVRGLVAMAEIRRNASSVSGFCARLRRPQKNSEPIEVQGILSCRCRGRGRPVPILLLPRLERAIAYQGLQRRRVRSMEGISMSGLSLRQPPTIPSLRCLGLPSPRPAGRPCRMRQGRNPRARPANCSYILFPKGLSARRFFRGTARPIPLCPD